MCTPAAGTGLLTSSNWNPLERVVGQSTFRKLDPLMGQAERTAATWWENKLGTKLGMGPAAVPDVPALPQASTTADTNLLYRSRQNGNGGYAGGSLLAPTLSGSGGSSLLGG